MMSLVFLPSQFGLNTFGRHDDNRGFFIMRPNLHTPPRTSFYLAEYLPTTPHIVIGSATSRQAKSNEAEKSYL
jgi:hypothetical protein